jgi:hypothetical protein
MQAIFRSSSCVAIVLMGLTGPAVAADRAMPAVVPTVAVPKTTLVPDLASRALVPAVAPAVLRTPAVGAANAAVVPVVATPAIAATAASVRPLDTPRVDVMPRTIVTPQPGVTSRLEVRTTHDATRALTAKGNSAAASRGQVTADTADSGATGDTRLAVNSNGTVTDAVAAAEAAPAQSRPVVLPTCR